MIHEILTGKKCAESMIHEILTGKKCAECRGCCFFDKNDDWEIPASVTATAANPDSDLLICDFLTECGCSLKEEKPLECAIYPFRVMQLGGYRVIALCVYCKAVTELSLSRIVKFTEGKAEEFFALADKHPEIVKKYNPEYVILKVEMHDCAEKGNG